MPPVFPLANSLSVNRTSTHANAVVDISFPMNRIASTWRRCSSVGPCSGVLICLFCWMAASGGREEYVTGEVFATRV